MFDRPTGSSEAQCGLIEARQPIDIAHGQPIGDGCCGTRPQPLERALDAQGTFPAHPPLVDAMRAHRAIGICQGALEKAADVGVARAAKWTSTRQTI